MELLLLPSLGYLCASCQVPCSLLRIEHGLDMFGCLRSSRPVSKVLHLFKRVTDEDAELLWMDSRVGRPENLIIENLLVPPVPIRPSVAMDIGGGSNEDDLTVKLQEIIDVNASVKAALDNGANVKMIMENWDFLQVSSNCCLLVVRRAG